MMGRLIVVHKYVMLLPHKIHGLRLFINEMEV